MSLHLNALIGFGAGGGGVPPNFQSASTGTTNTAANTLAINYPSSIQVNDIIIAVCGGEDSGGTSPGDTSLTGGGISNFTAIASRDNTDGKGCSWIGYKRATGSESGTETATMSSPGGTRAMYGIMYLFRGCITSGSPADGADGAQNASSTTWTQKTLTTTVASDLACHFVVGRANSVGTAGNFTGESGGDFTEQNLYSSANGCIQLQTSAADTATTISGGSLTAGVTGIYHTHTFGLKPA